MIKKVVFYISFFFLTATIYPQGGLDYSALLPLLDAQSRSGQSDKEKVQAMFIQQMFVKSIMSSDLDFSDEDDEDSTLSKDTRNFYNSMLSYEISKTLAKQDILGFNKLDLDL